MIFNFTGFFQPVDAQPGEGRQRRAGQFNLGGNQGLGFFAAGYSTSVVVACAATSTVDDIEATVTAGSISLTYDATANQYVYVWKTDGAWLARAAPRRSSLPTARSTRRTSP